MLLRRGHGAVVVPIANRASVRSPPSWSRRLRNRSGERGRGGGSDPASRRMPGERDNRLGTPSRSPRTASGIESVDAPGKPRRAAKGSDATVLIAGESGTGRNVVADPSRARHPEEPTSSRELRATPRSDEFFAPTGRSRAEPALGSSCERHALLDEVERLPPAVQEAEPSSNGAPLVSTKPGRRRRPTADRREQRRSRR